MIFLKCKWWLDIFYFFFWWKRQDIGREEFEDRSCRRAATSISMGGCQSRAVRLHPIYQIYCQAKCEQMVHWIQLITVLAVLCDMYAVHVDITMMINFDRALLSAWYDKTDQMGKRLELKDCRNEQIDWRCVEAASQATPGWSPRPFLRQTHKTIKPKHKYPEGRLETETPCEDL